MKNEYFNYLSAFLNRKINKNVLQILKKRRDTFKEVKRIITKENKRKIQIKRPCTIQYKKNCAALHTHMFLEQIKSVTNADTVSCCACFYCLFPIQF